VLALWPLALRQLRALAVLAELTGVPLAAASEALLLEPVMEASTSLRGTAGQVRARRYVARTGRPGDRPAALLLHGAHPRGIDEPRLVALARALAQAGLDVLTPEISALRQLQLSGSIRVELRVLAAEHARRAHVHAVGAIGISFAGGLALLAAAEQQGDAPIGFVVGVGAHHDLTRVCEFYAQHDVRGPDGEPVAVAPHPYGARVMLQDQLPQLIAAADLAGAQLALGSYLADRPREARKLAERLSPDAQRVMRVLLDERGSTELSGYLMHAVEVKRSQLLAASPRGHLQGLRVPVLLIHGEGDPVIPSIETRYLAREVPAHLLRAALITPLLRHAEFPGRPSLASTWPVVSFLRRIFEAAGSARTPRHE
jgi:pimeloyl-ACP methyl ester carboxylesterase